MESSPVACREQSPRNNKYQQSPPNPSLSTCSQFHVCSFKSSQSSTLPDPPPLRADPLNTFYIFLTVIILFTSHSRSRYARSDQHFYKYIDKAGPWSTLLVEECRGLALIGRELHSVATPALLCNKEPSQGTQSLLLGAL